MTGNGRMILVAEDSPTQAERLRLLLAGQGYRVEVAADGREGLTLMRESPPDLIISDVVMPELDGYAFCRAVKSAESTRRIPFVLLTDRTGPEDILQGLTLGADNFITKPFEDGQLLERVHRIFEQLELRQRGQLEVEIDLRVGARHLVITADKQQIIELLFATFEELGQVNRQLADSQKALERYARDLETKVGQLASERNRSVAILVSIAEGVLVTDPDGIIVSINPAMERLAGWRAHEVCGSRYAEVYNLVDTLGTPLPPDQGLLADALTWGEPASSRGYDRMLLTRDGRNVPVSVTAAPILDRMGNVLGGVGVLRDCSREREVDQLKSSLISTVSHELRTPLTMIQGFSELLLTRELDEAKVREALGQIHASAGRLGRLIEDLLSVSRIESGRLEVRARPVELAAVFQEAVVPFEQARAVRLVDVDPNCRVLADPDVLLQILTNLLSNAVKYSPPEAQVAIRTCRRDTTVEVMVEDQGIGMSEEEQAQLFGKFFRADRPAVREVEGTGLGLYISKNLVERLGGKLWVKSSLGQGSTFGFSLPLVTDRSGD